MRRLRRTARGFTLIEVVVAVLLLAIMSIMAWQALEVVLDANSRSRAAVEQEIELRRAWRQIDDDLFHLRASPWADGLGGIEPAYLTGQTEVLLSFSRGGLPATSDNPAGMGRIQYVLEDDRLLRRHWPLRVSPRETEAVERTLLTGLDSIRFEQLNSQSVFGENWPPLNETHSLGSLPPMIRIRIELENGHTTERLIPGLGRPRPETEVPDES